MDDSLLDNMSQNQLMSSASAGQLNLMSSQNFRSSSQSVAGSPVSSNSRMSLTAAAVAAASASHRGSRSHLADLNNHNQWEVHSSSSSSSISQQNSMECWDYTIELECLQGPEGGDLLFTYRPCCH